MKKTKPTTIKAHITYLLKHLPTYLRPRDPHRAPEFKEDQL